MAVCVVGLLLLLAMADHSDAAYCVCSSGGDIAFQRNIDYACGAGADCSAILPSGPCYNPNTVRDHCSYAVNSFYQRKGQTPGSCDFGGTASVSPTVPNVAPGCMYPSNPSGGSTTPAFGGTQNPSTGGSPRTGATPGYPFIPGIGFSQSGTAFPNPDGGSALFMLLFLSFALLFRPRI